jgi:peptidoglycan/LPS O-acetylase OafA/YrhL
VSSNVVSMLVRTHADSWFWILIFFLLSYVFLRKEKTTLEKVAKGLFRLVSLVMVVTGIGMLIAFHFPATYVVKGILAILMLGVMEAILGMTKRGKKTGSYWILVIILFVLVLLLAMRVISF